MHSMLPIVTPHTWRLVAAWGVVMAVGVGVVLVADVGLVGKARTMGIPREEPQLRSTLRVQPCMSACASMVDNGCPVS
jgi:hypothetical protein